MRPRPDLHETEVRPRLATMRPRPRPKRGLGLENTRPQWSRDLNISASPTPVDLLLLFHDGYIEIPGYISEVCVSRRSYTVLSVWS